MKIKKILIFFCIVSGACAVVCYILSLVNDFFVWPMFFFGFHGIMCLLGFRSIDDNLAEHFLASAALILFGGVFLANPNDFYPVMAMLFSILFVLEGIGLFVLWIKRLVRKREHKEELGAPVVKLNPTVKENTAVRVKPPVATRPATVVNPVAKDLPKPGQIVCSRCKVTVPQREAVLNQNHWFCANCSQPFKKSAEEQKSILREHCCKCKKLVSNQEFVFADGSYYCAACFSAEYPQEDWSIKMM